MFDFFRSARQGFRQQQRWTSIAATTQFRNEQSLNPLLIGSTAALSVLAWNYFSEQHKADACGIVGYVGEESSVNFLLEGLRILQNRGYDSAGIATISPDASELVVTKYASVGSTSDSIELLAEKAPSFHGDNMCGIAHTRWATHGAKTDENAHPHTDYKKRIAIVHNGTIENCTELKKELIQYGIHFESQTDTEVIAQLIGYYLDQNMPPVEALRKALTRLEGSWGLCMVSKDNPSEIICTCNGSPLLVGVDDSCKRMFVASEHTAFQRYTNEVIPLKDGEIAIIRPGDLSLDRSRVIKTKCDEEILLTPDPYPHWTIKEIHDQPVAVLRALGFGSRLNSDLSVRLGGLDKEKDTMESIKNLTLSACGTSLYAAKYGALIFRYLKAVDTVNVIDAAECDHDSFPTHGAGLLVLSQSGETKDVIRVLDKASQLGVPSISLVNSVGSYIARKTGLGVYLYAGREHAVASTKAFMNQIICLSLVAGYFVALKPSEQQAKLRLRNLVDALLRMSAYITITLRTQDQCKKIANEIKDVKTMFVLGKGFAHPIALEGALKIKEISYIHAEGYSGGALKHGPFALIEEGTPVIMIIPDDVNARQMVTACHEVEARGANLIVITDNAQLLDGLHTKNIIRIPSNDILTALLAAVPLQMIAYELSIAKGLNPDKPRNLAKAVTVD